MLRLAAALLVRVGLVFLIMATLARLVPMPNKADVVADEFAIVVNGALVLMAAIYLRLTKDAGATLPSPKTPKPPSDLKSVQRIQRSR